MAALPAGHPNQNDSKPPTNNITQYNNSVKKKKGRRTDEISPGKRPKRFIPLIQI